MAGAAGSDSRELPSTRPQGPSSADQSTPSLIAVTGNRAAYVCAHPRFIPTSDSRLPVRGRWTKVRCLSRRCGGCARTMALWDRDFIEGGIRHHQEHGRLLLFLSLSEPLDARPYRDSGAALTLLLRDLNRFAGNRSAGLSWCAVGEWGEKSRRFHWHVTIAGLAYPWCSRSASLFPKNVNPGQVVNVLGLSGTAVSKNALKPLIARRGFGGGFIGMRQVGVTTGDVGNVSNYLSKYLAKGDAGADLPKGFQLVRASRARSAWWPGHSLMSVRADHREALREKRQGVKDRLFASANASPRRGSLTPLLHATQPTLPLGDS